jgi:hypothetical protein
MVATTDTLRTLFRLAKFIDAKVTRNDGLLAALEGAFRSGDDAQLNAAALDVLHAAEAVR